MDGFTETIKQAYEMYSKGDVKGALSQLTPNTEHYDYIKVMEAMKADKKGLLKNTQKEITEYLRRHAYGGIELRRHILNKIIEMKEYDFLKTINDSVSNVGLDFYYNHEKPYYAQNTGQKGEENLGPNEWKQEEHFSDEAEIKKVYDSLSSSGGNYSQFLQLHKSLWNELDFNKFSNHAFEYIMDRLESFAVIVHDSFINKLAAYYKEKYDEPNYGIHYTLPTNHLEKMTLVQMDQLKKKLPRTGNDYSFKCTYFSKTYHYYFQDPEFYESASLEEKRDFLVRVLNEYKEDQDLRSSIIKEILVYGIKLDVYDEKYFIEFLKNPTSSDCIRYKGPSNIQGGYWRSSFSNLCLPFEGFTKMYSTILEHYYNLAAANK
jgi:hypothetical protein